MNMLSDKETLQPREKYNQIFDSDEIKARAFDKIAENYYFRNFGTMQKSDIDVLLFSIYIEEILKKSEDNISTYSDYTLAKLLGISQSRISTLKVKKQLQYPYSEFDWKKSFRRVCENARYEKGKILINLRDKNLYYELKNQIDENGGYVETTLTSNLLVISVYDFYELSEQLMTPDEIGEIKKALKKKYKNDTDIFQKIEQQPLGKMMKEKFGENMVDIVCEIIKEIAPNSVKIGIGILQTAYKAISNNIKEK